MRLFYFDGEERKGPITSVELRLLARRGIVRRSTILETPLGSRESAENIHFLISGLSLENEFAVAEDFVEREEQRAERDEEPRRKDDAQDSDEATLNAEGETEASERPRLEALDTSGLSLSNACEAPCELVDAARSDRSQVARARSDSVETSDSARRAPSEPSSAPSIFAAPRSQDAAPSPRPVVSAPSNAAAPRSQDAAPTPRPVVSAPSNAAAPRPQNVAPSPRPASSASRPQNAASLRSQTPDEDEAVELRQVPVPAKKSKKIGCVGHFFLWAIFCGFCDNLFDSDSFAISFVIPTFLYFLICVAIINIGKKFSTPEENDKKN